MQTGPTAAADLGGRRHGPPGLFQQTLPVPARAVELIDTNLNRLQRITVPMLVGYEGMAIARRPGALYKSSNRKGKVTSPDIGSYCA